MAFSVLRLKKIPQHRIDSIEVYTRGKHANVSSEFPIHYCLLHNKRFQDEEIEALALRTRLSKEMIRDYLWTRRR